METVIRGDALFEQRVTARFKEARDLLMQKHKDYGPKNIANAPGGPLVGLAVRLHDKLARLAHLTRTGAEMPKNESIRDTFIDIANYGVIGLLVLDGDWPGVEPAPVKPTTLTTNPLDFLNVTVT